MCAKFGYGPTVVSKKKEGGTDRQTDKGKLQHYIVDALVCPFLHPTYLQHSSVGPHFFHAPYVMTDHMSASTNFILSSFRSSLSFQIVSSSMVAFLTLPFLALMSSEQLPVFVLMARIYLKCKRHIMFAVNNVTTCSAFI